MVYNVGDRFIWTDFMAKEDGEAPCTVVEISLKYYGDQDKIGYTYDDEQGVIHHNGSHTIQDWTQKIS